MTSFTNASIYPLMLLRRINSRIYRLKKHLDRCYECDAAVEEAYREGKNEGLAELLQYWESHQIPVGDTYRKWQVTEILEEYIQMVQKKP